MNAPILTASRDAVAVETARARVAAADHEPMFNADDLFGPIAREPGEDDDEGEDEEDLVSVEDVLREARTIGADKIEHAVNESASSAFANIALGDKRAAPRGRFDLWNTLIQAHAWTAHAFVRVYDGERREYRSVPTKRCARGCKFCPTTVAR